ncbi:hypothetical protein OSTOST_07249, partial [Ostertagia ostertagi]
RKKKREEEGNANGTEDCAAVDNESNSPTEEDGDAAVPISWSSTATTAPAAGFCNDLVEEEEVIDELDHLTEVQIGYDSAALAYEKTEEELQAELDELEEVEIEENEDIEQESKSDCDKYYTSYGTSKQRRHGANYCHELNANTSDLSPLTSESQHSSNNTVEIQPPISVLHPKERLNQWLDENPSSPHLPEENMNDPLQRRTDDSDMMDPPVSGIDEIARQNFCRRLHYFAANALQSCCHHVTSGRSMTLRWNIWQNLYIYVSWKKCNRISVILMPIQFRLFLSRNDGHHIRKIFLHETMLTAQSAMTRDDHLIIFFDTEPPQLREEKSSVLEDVVHAHFLSLPHV